MWLITNKGTFEIVSCNPHRTEDGIFQLWVTRTNDKSVKIAESKNENEITEIKNAIDYAIENNINSFRLDD